MSDFQHGDLVRIVSHEFPELVGLTGTVSITAEEYASVGADPWNRVTTDIMLNDPRYRYHESYLDCPDTPLTLFMPDEELDLLAPGL